MSYLSHPLRLHFAGSFQATVSTVNNDVTHFNNATFQSNYQLRQTSPNMRTPDNGWWNPAGDGVWRLLGCDITSAFMADGKPVSAKDPVLALQIADSGNSVPAKIVDLDPQQQMVSTIFGLVIRIADGNGNSLMEGHFEPVAFTDLWSKIQQQGGGDAAYGAMWQSVVTVTHWGDVSHSPFLTDLQKSAQANGNLLSIKFNVDLYNMSWPDPTKPKEDNRFCRGRVVGTLGTATTTEPRHFVAGRQLLTQAANSAGQSYINYCAAVVDTKHEVVRLDLGNALPVDTKGHTLNQGDITLLVTDFTGANHTIGAVAASGPNGYTNANWYRTTAGIVEVPLPASLAKLVADNPIGLTMSGVQGVVTGELPPSQLSDGTSLQGGLYVRADLFVFRLSPGSTADGGDDATVSATVTFYATQYGRPAADQEIILAFNDGPIQAGSGQPPTGTPSTGLVFPTSVTTGKDGVATLKLTGGDTKKIRGYIDGQVYAIGYALASQGYSPAPNQGNPASNYETYADGWNFISVLVFDKFITTNPPTWYGPAGQPEQGLYPIFQQYANLYPVMSRFVDLGDYNQVIGYTLMLGRAFGLPDSDPNAMPVTRDLSPAKRRAILTWLNESTPPLGDPSNAPKAPVLLAASPAVTRGAASPAVTHPPGGKAAAAARMARKPCGLI